MEKIKITFVSNPFKFVINAVAEGFAVLVRSRNSRAGASVVPATAAEMPFAGESELWLRYSECAIKWIFSFPTRNRLKLGVERDQNFKFRSAKKFQLLTKKVFKEQLECLIRHASVGKGGFQF